MIKLKENHKRDIEGEKRTGGLTPKTLDLYIKKKNQIYIPLSDKYCSNETLCLSSLKKTVTFHRAASSLWQDLSLIYLRLDRGHTNLEATGLDRWNVVDWDTKLHLKQKSV